MSTLETPVAFFRSLSAKKAKSRPIVSILEEIRNGKHAAAICDIRQPGLSKEERGELKRALPAIMVSGTSKGGRKAIDFLNHSGLLQIDLDNVGEDKAASLRDTIGQDPHILAAFVSPSGNGVKAFICIPAMKDTHPAAFATVAFYIRDCYGVEMDATCKEINRLCFVSHDPDLVVNADAVEMEIPTEFHQPTKLKGKSAFSGDKPQRHGEGEGVREAEDAPHTPLNSSERLRARDYVLRSAGYALQQAAALEDFPKLREHYDRNITKFFAKPTRGHRNRAIVAIAAKLFHVVRPEFVLLMLNEFKREHWDVYESYDGDFDGEALAMVEGMLAQYPSELNEAEKSHYLDLPLEKQAAFRILRSLAKCESDPDFPPPNFFQSRNELANRLGQYGSENAKWIFNDLQKRGIIELVKLGTQRAKGVKGEASVWRWMMFEGGAV